MNELKEIIKCLQNNPLIKSGAYEFIGDSNVTYAEIYTLLEHIRNIEKQNAELKEKINNYENPEDLTLFYMWLDEKTKDKMKELKEENEHNKEFLNKLGFANVEQVGLSYIALKEENERLKNNWNELKKMIEDTIIALHETAINPNDEFIVTFKGTFGRVLNMMQELEEKEVK